jgi:hypothetical protein
VILELCANGVRSGALRQALRVGGVVPKPRDALAQYPDPSLCRAHLPRQQVLHVRAAAATPSFVSCSPDQASRRRSVQFLFGYRFRRLSISYSSWPSRRLFLSELAQLASRRAIFTR